MSFLPKSTDYPPELEYIYDGAYEHDQDEYEDDHEPKDSEIVYDQNEVA